MSNYVMNLKTERGDGKTGKVYVSEQEETFDVKTINGEKVLEQTLGGILKKAMDKDKRLYANFADEQFKGENDTEKLIACLLQQVDSFWAMFYCEFWFIFNFILRNAGILFPPEKGFVWTNAANVPINFMISEDVDKSTRAFKEMSVALRNYIECIVRVTPSIMEPVGLQHLFMVNLVCIHSATNAIRDVFCNESSWLGGCSKTCGGEFTSTAKDIQVRKFQKMSKFIGSKGGASSGPGNMKETTAYCWMVIRDKIISLASVVDDAMFVTTMFTNVACGIFGDLSVYEPQQLDDQQAADPIKWGIIMRNDPTPNPLIHQLSVPFDYTAFALNLACHTGNQVVSYLPPVSAYENDLQIAKAKGVSEAFFHKAWCNSMGLFEREIMTNIMDRMLKESKVYPLKPVSLETATCSDPNMIGLSEFSSVYYRIALNSHHHLPESMHKHMAKKFVQEMAPDVPRNGLDDYHRNSYSPKGSSLVINWTKHIFYAFPRKNKLLMKFLMRAAGSYIQEGVEEIVASENAKKELLEMEDNEKKVKKRKTKKKNKKKNRNSVRTAIKHSDSDTDETHTDEEMSATEPLPENAQPPPKEEPTKSTNPIAEKMIREGAALVICREMRKYKEKIVKKRNHSVWIITSWYRYQKSRIRIKEVREHNEKVMRVIKRLKDKKATSIARWYRKVYNTWASKRQIVVYDPEVYIAHLRERERALNTQFHVFSAQVHDFNNRIAKFNMQLKLHQVMCQVEHYMVRTTDDFVEQNLCPETLSLSLLVLSGFPRLKMMIQGFDMVIIAEACRSSMCLKVVYNTKGEIAIRNIYR